MNKQIELTITNKHLGSNYNFLNTSSCPLAKAVKEANITQHPSVDIESVRDTELNKNVGTVTPNFTERNFNELRFGVINEFKTTFTYY
jgi:hypothetical protein